MKFITAIACAFLALFMSAICLGMAGLLKVFNPKATSF